MTTLSRYLRFLLAGTLFSTVEELLTVGLLKRDVPSYVFTLIVLFPIFLTVVYLSGQLIERIWRGNPYADAWQFVFHGMLGLQIEWFLIGLAPWSNPAANPVLMALFQLGMFSFWATVSFAPRLFTRGDEHSRSTRRSVLRIYIPYFVIVYIVAFTLSPQDRFAPTIILIVIGYYVATFLLIRYVWRRIRDSNVARQPQIEGDSR